MARATRAALLGAACLAAALPIAAIGGGSGYDLPDLVGDAPAAPYLQRYLVDTHGVGQVNRLLMRFDGHVRNDGPGPLDFQGDPSAQTVVQHVQPGGGGALTPWVYGAGEARPEFVYSTADGHDHWHLQAVVEYSMWDEAGTAPVKPGSKTGFCLYDIDRIGGHGPAGPVYDGPMTGDFCRRGDPAATGLRTGVSAGWRDVYEGGLAFQWIDVSDVAPGRYRLAARPDPGDVVREADESNNGAVLTAGTVTVPGHLARPVTAATRAGRGVTVTLAAETVSHPAFGTPGPRRFRIRTVPATGTLTAGGQPVAAGDRLGAGVTAVRYTAPDGFTGTASFTYTAEDADSPFPTDGSGIPQAGAVQATATVTVGPAAPLTVGIAGAPARIVPGGVARLRAVVAGGDGGVEWSVQGIPGGDAAVGRVAADGRYIAPAAVPPGGAVRIRATSSEDPDAWAQVRVVVGVPLPGGPAPSPEGELAPGELLGTPGVRRFAGTHVATVRAAVGGRVVVTAERAGRRLAGCASVVAAGQSLACRMRLADAAGVRIVARLRAADGRRRTTVVGLERALSWLGPLRARRDGGRVTTAVTALRPGVVATDIRAGGRLMRCRQRVGAGGTATCRRAVPPRGPVTVTARLRAAGVTGARVVRLGAPAEPAS